MQSASDDTFLPERLNLSIGNRCFVTCPGCYSNFGQREPNVARLLECVARFVDLGVRDVTVSGGDPLTIDNHLWFLDEIRRLKVRSIKFDTVGTHLIRAPLRLDTPVEVDPRPALRSLLMRLDFVGIPLDGWSNATVNLFRTGRPRLYDETVELLNAIDSDTRSPMVIINTVAHAMNLKELSRIGEEILRHPMVCHWNIFQYSPTDQVSAEVNATYCVTDAMFQMEDVEWCNSQVGRCAAANGIVTEFRSVRSRLGQYLLVNSDGVAWIPDECGRTIELGFVHRNECQVLSSWRNAVRRLRVLRQPSDRNGA